MLSSFFLRGILLNFRDARLRNLIPSRCGNVWEMCEGRWMAEGLPLRGECFRGWATFIRITGGWTPENPI